MMLKAEALARRACGQGLRIGPVERHGLEAFALCRGRFVVRKTEAGWRLGECVIPYRDGWVRWTEHDPDLLPLLKRADEATRG